MERGRQLTEPVVVQAAAGQAARAAALAARLGLELHDGPRTPSTTPALVVGEAGLELRLGAGPAVLERLDLLQAPRSGGSDPLYRAVLSGTETVVDATAGLGADSFHLAARGVEVTMIERSGEYRPREWALANISAPRTSARLNEILKTHALRTGRPWTTDIVPLCRRYVPRYLDEADRRRLQAGVKRLRLKHGIVLDEFVSEREAAARNAAGDAARTGAA